MIRGARPRSPLVPQVWLERGRAHNLTRQWPLDLLRRATVVPSRLRLARTGMKGLKARPQTGVVCEESCNASPVPLHTPVSRGDASHQSRSMPKCAGGGRQKRWSGGSFLRFSTYSVWYSVCPELAWIGRDLAVRLTVPGASGFSGDTVIPFGSSAKPPGGAWTRMRWPARVTRPEGRADDPVRSVRPPWRWDLVGPR